MGTVIVVSHDRHFLNNVCTHIVDIDYGKIKMYVGNYDFWYESSRLVQQMIKDQNKKDEEKIKELQTFIQRFSANKSKSRQATSRRKLLDKLTVEEMPASSRRYPWVSFKAEREVGQGSPGGGEPLRGTGRRDPALRTSQLPRRAGRTRLPSWAENEMASHRPVQDPHRGGGAGLRAASSGASAPASPISPRTTPPSSTGCDLNLIEWLRQYSSDDHESYLRGFLGRMLFSGDEPLKPVKVLSGGEKVRCMLSRMMLSGANVLLLDQPTNHLDLESITALNNGLIDFKGVILFASHDHQFMQTSGQP